MTNSSVRPTYVSFDCYGTLIDFDVTGATRMLLGGRLAEPEVSVFLRQFRNYRYDAACGDFQPYQQVLHDAYARTCARWGLRVDDDAGARLAAAVMASDPHDDVVSPLRKLSERYPLVILSNADTRFLDVSMPKLGAPFHSVFTAEQAGAYKPRYQAFEYMLDQLDAGPESFLHVSSHTRYDLMPADDLGFTHKVFLDRGYDPDSPAYDYTTVRSLDELDTILDL